LPSLFIKLHLDEDVNVLVADLLRARGFNVVTTVEAGNLNHDDDQQLEYAVSHQRAIFTHNRADFEVRALEYFAAGKNSLRHHRWHASLALRTRAKIASHTEPNDGR